MKIFGIDFGKKDKDENDKKVVIDDSIGEEETLETFSQPTTPTKKKFVKRVSKKAPKKKLRRTNFTTKKMSKTSVLVKPYYTEKAADSSEKSIYIFEVNSRAGKREVASAIKEKYNVIPKKVNILTTSSKPTSLRRVGRAGRTQVKKKAYVYLAKGDKIQFS
ncbi:MAG: 50S ribosomal protein L23 [Candidatus Campbellbacteria bacterium]|nr:50S ribosomal protein L23 [Candidatus Campbellbacteria bacterium]